MIARLMAILLATLLAAPAAAQQGAALLERAKTEKKAWIALNMELAPADAEGFWPVYEAFQKDIGRINTRVVGLLESYAAHYRAHSLTDESARKLLDESLSIDESYVKLRRSYIARLAKVLSARQAARYLQLEDRMHTQMRYEVGANLPLIGDVRVTAPKAAK